MYYIDTYKIDKDLKKLTQNKIAYKKYQKIINAIKINPYNPPDVSKKHFGKLTDQKFMKHDIYHIDVTSVIRIHYIIDKEENKIIIENIEYDGLVTLLNVLNHDLNSKKK